MIISFSNKKNYVTTGSTNSVLNIRPDPSTVGLDNNIIVDSSTETNLISVGQQEQGSFSPYLPDWSIYFDGNGDKITSSSWATVANLGSGDFTIEFWIYARSFSSSTILIDTRSSTVSSNGWYLYITSTRSLVLVNNNITLMATGDSTISFNRWAHVAYVRRSGTLVCYINGITRNTVQSTVLMDSAALSIGSKSFLSSGFQDFYGYISNLRLVVGSGVYPSEFTVPIKRLSNHPDTTLLIAQSNRLIDASWHNASLSTGATPAISPFNPFLEENNYTRVSQNLYSDVSSFNSNRSAYFDGIGDYAAISYSANFALESLSTWTFEVWIYLNFENFSRKRIAGTMSAASTSGWAIDITEDRKILFTLSTDKTYINPTVVDLNKWHHIAITRDSTELKFYINGKPDQKFSIQNGVSNFNNLTIGTSPEPYAYLGFMSNLRINSSAVLYQSEFEPKFEPLKPLIGTVLLLFQNDTFVDNGSSNQQVFTFGSIKMTPAGPFAPSVGSSLVKAGSNYFSGNYIETEFSSRYDLLADFTIECWIFLTGTSTSESTILFGNQNGQTTGLFFGFTNQTDGNRLGVSFNNSTIVWAVSTVTQTTLLNRWTHIAWTRIQNTNRLFVNGIMQTVSGDTTGTAFADNSSLSNLKLTIGKNIVGYISNLRYVTGKGLYYRNFHLEDLYLKNIDGTKLLLNFDNYKLNDLSNCNNIRMKNVLINADSQSNSGSMTFNGTSSIVTIRNNLLLNPLYNESYTAECWIYPINSSGTQFIMGMSNVTSTNWSFRIVNNFYQFRIGSSTYTHNVSVTLNTWTHLALCFAAANNLMTCYINGSRVNSTTVVSFVTTDLNFTMGATSNETNFFQGRISNVRLIKGITLYRGATVPIAL